MRAPTTLLTFALCVVLAVVRIAGAHVHLKHGTVVKGHADYPPATVIEEDAPQHLFSHLHQGDIDANDSVQLLARSVLDLGAFLPVLLWLAVWVSELLPSLQTLASRPELRPPRRRRAYLISPPSHAPPVAS